MTQGLIEVPVSLLQDLANKMEALSDAGQDIFDRIRNSLLTMQTDGTFVGAAAQATLAVTESNQVVFADVMEELYDLCTFLKRYSNDMETADLELSKAIQAI